MKSLKVLTLVLLVGSIVQAQENPVNWTYSAKKVAKDKFEIKNTIQVISNNIRIK